MQHSIPGIKDSSFKGIIGVAQYDITPPAGIYSRNWGAALHDVADGIHQPLYMSCICFRKDDGSSPLILIGVDLVSWKTVDDEYFVRGAVIDALGIGPEAVMICLSHTHAGPSASLSDADKTGGHYIPEYLLKLREAAVFVAKKAYEEGRSATLSWRYGTCDLAANRDLQVGDDGRYVVGFNPLEKADDTLLVGRVTDERNVIIGTIVNYACHPTTLAWDNRLISPDYVGAMRAVVEGHTGAPCLFMQGASGELAPAEQYVGDTAVAERNGRRLGYAVLSTLESMLSPASQLAFDAVVESGAALATWKNISYDPDRELVAALELVPFPLKPLPSLEEIEKNYEACADRVLKERLFRKKNVRKATGDGDTAETPVWVWRLGNSFLVGQPNEAYSVLQKELRLQIPSAVAVMNLVNGSIGYLPTKNFYDKDIYTEWQTPFAAGSLELLIEKSIETIHNIAGNQAPVPEENIAG